MLSGKDSEMMFFSILSKTLLLERKICFNEFQILFRVFTFSVQTLIHEKEIFIDTNRAVKTQKAARG